jgi:hypothetical protein
MEKTWKFDTTIGQGSEIVTVVYEYEIDDDKSTYNESVKQVWFEGRDIVGCMSEEAYAELDIEASMRFHEHKQNYKQTEDYQP